MTSALGRIEDSRVVAIIRAQSPDVAMEVGLALIDEGIDVVEVSLTTPEAVSVIRELAGIESACIGAGTVLTPQKVIQCVTAGAKFIVAPNSDERVISQAVNDGVPIAAGVFTATDCATALEAGAELLKLFPASIGGIPLMKALSGPFPQARWLPTGGIDATNAPDWWLAGASAVGVGGSLTAGPISNVRAQARELRLLASSNTGRG